MRTLFSISSIVLVLLVAGPAGSHERQEIGGMTVVFGGNPEPLLDSERCFLQWRFTDLKTKEPVANLQDLRLTIRFDGKEFGPFEARRIRRSPGMYQTHHIFTKPGEGEATVTFKKEGEDKPLSLTLPFRIGSRKAIESP